jgi:hypothetical protein
MTPFILRGRRELAPESAPSADHVFDRTLQIWIDKLSGKPLVLAIRGHEASPFGETPMTKTFEGNDQSEGAQARVSPFGETSFTETREGEDQSEVSSILASPFGKTTITRIQESANTSETSLMMSGFGETTYTASQEGHDQRESPLPTPLYDEVEDDERDNQGRKGASFVPPYSHF